MCFSVTKFKSIERIRCSNGAKLNLFILIAITNHFKAVIICRRGNNGKGTILNSFPKRFVIKPYVGRIFINVKNKRKSAFFFVFHLT